MTQPSNPPEEERLQRLRVLMDKAIAADLEAPRILPLVGTAYEASVRDVPGPARRAILRAVESGLALLEYDVSPPEQYWVPLTSLQWLKVLRE